MGESLNTKAARINGLEVSVCGEHELPQFVERRITHIVSIWNGYKADHVQEIHPPAAWLSFSITFQSISSRR